MVFAGPLGKLKQVLDRIFMIHNLFLYHWNKPERSQLALRTFLLIPCRKIELSSPISIFYCTYHVCKIVPRDCFFQWFGHCLESCISGDQGCESMSFVHCGDSNCIGDELGSFLLGDGCHRNKGNLDLKRGKDMKRIKYSSHTQWNKYKASLRN